MRLHTLTSLLCLAGFAVNAQPEMSVDQNLGWNCSFFNECQQGLTCKDADLNLSIGYQVDNDGLAEVWFPISADNPQGDPAWGHLTQLEEDGLFNISGIIEAGRNGESTFTISISPSGWTAMTSHQQVIGALSAISRFGNCQRMGN